MNNDKMGLTTEELLQKLKKTKNIDDFLNKNEDEMVDADVGTYLYELLEKSGMTIPQIIEKASIGRSLAYQIFNGQRTPNRNILLRMAFILKLNLVDTQRLLRMAKKGELYPRIQRDAAIIYCLERKYSLIDVNEMLENLGEAILLKEE